MRFEVISAFVIGGLIPVLATCLHFCRHGFSLSLADLTGNLPDYLAGGLLLFAAWASIPARSFAPVFLVLAWAYCTSLMASSFLGQIEDTLRGQAEPENAIIILSKLGILSASVLSLAISLRRAVRTNV